MTEEDRFKIGQMVEVIKDYDSIPKGTRGEIIVKNKGGTTYGLKLTKKSAYAHDLGGECENGFGYWVNEIYLRIIEEKKEIKQTIEYKAGMKIDNYVKKIIKSIKGNSLRKKWLKVYLNCVLPKQVKEMIEESLTVVLRAEMFEKWGINKHFEKGLTNSILLYGQAGTGKTMVCECLASILDKNLLKLDSGVLQSNIPGQTERNIEENFKKAEEQNAVLMLDECDSLLYNRESVGAIMSSEINSLLTAIERFNGIVVLTTNRLHKLDNALQRRIIAKIELPLPDKKARLQIWKNLIPKELPLSEDVDFNRLSEFELSGGEIKNAILLGSRKAIAKNKEKVKLEYFIEVIEGIIKSKEDFSQQKINPYLECLK